jgi:hypothetical protein
MHKKMEAGNQKLDQVLSESRRGAFRQGGLHLVQTMSYEADDVKEADDQ